MEAMLGEKLLSKNGEVDKSAFTSAPVTLLYFSAHWCPPCRSFTPKLAQFYNSVNQPGKEIEVVFVSLDRAEGDFQSYYDSMPWLAVPFNGPRQNLQAHYGINSIPTLLLVKKDGTVANSKCREEVETTGPQVVSQWRGASN